MSYFKASLVDTSANFYSGAIRLRLSGPRGFVLRLEPKPGVRFMGAGLPEGDPLRFSPDAGRKHLFIDPHGDDIASFAPNLYSRVAGASECEDFSIAAKDVMIINPISDPFGVYDPRLDFQSKQRLRDEEFENFRVNFVADKNIPGDSIDMAYPFDVQIKDSDWVEKGRVLSSKLIFGKPKLMDAERAANQLLVYGPDYVIMPHLIDSHDMHRSVMTLYLYAIANLIVSGIEAGNNSPVSSGELAAKTLTAILFESWEGFNRVKTNLYNIIDSRKDQRLRFDEFFPSQRLREKQNRLMRTAYENVLRDKTPELAAIKAQLKFPCLIERFLMVDIVVEQVKVGDKFVEIGEYISSVGRGRVEVDEQAEIDISPGFEKASDGSAHLLNRKTIEPVTPAEDDLDASPDGNNGKLNEVILDFLPDVSEDDET